MTWGSVVPTATAARAVAVAREVAARLATPDSLPPATHRPTRLRDGASGAVGCALLLGQFTGHDWESAAHRCLGAAVGDIAQAGFGFPGLFDGLAGVAFATATLSRDGARYRHLLADVDRLVIRNAIARANAVTHAPRGLPFEAFDIISGLAGIGAYLLRRREIAEAKQALRAVLTALVAVCRWDAGVPNWYTPPSRIAPGTPMAESFPGGVLNCGLAHGVPGPLALLALAELDGVSVAGQRASITTVAHWLAAQRVDDEYGPNWPKGVALPRGTAVGAPAARNAWCYGGPGVARALWLAGKAIADAELRALAVDAMAAAWLRLASVPDPDTSPGLCHGIAGLLQITARFTQDTGDARFARATVALTDLLLDLYDPGYPFGFRFSGEDPQDRPGLLDGAAGPALALLAAGTDVPPAWDRMLLLA